MEDLETERLQEKILDQRKRWGGARDYLTKLMNKMILWKTIPM